MFFFIMHATTWLTSLTNSRAHLHTPPGVQTSLFTHTLELNYLRIPFSLEKLDYGTAYQKTKRFRELCTINQLINSYNHVHLFSSMRFVHYK